MNGAVSQLVTMVSLPVYGQYVSGLRKVGKSAPTWERGVRAIGCVCYLSYMYLLTWMTLKQAGLRYFAVAGKCFLLNLCANDWNKKCPYIRHASFRFDLVPDLFMQANSVMHIYSNLQIIFVLTKLLSAVSSANGLFTFFSSFHCPPGTHVTKSWIIFCCLGQQKRCVPLICTSALNRSKKMLEALCVL